MRFKIYENIYGKNSNNKINKRKHKHSLSPFCKLDGGNVEYNIQSFNRSMGDNNSDISSFSLGETLSKDTNELKSELDYLDESQEPTYTYSYKGPVYRFEKVYTVLKEPIYTSAKNEKQAVNFIKGKLKKQFGFDYKAKLDIDEDNIQLVIKQDDNLMKKEISQDYDYDESDFVGSFNNRDIYFIDGKYIVDNMEFSSFDDLKDFLED